jgi:hypothetical protein
LLRRTFRPSYSSGIDVENQGPLLILGEAVKGRSYVIPGVGRIRDVALANVQAAARLAFNF